MNLNEATDIAILSIKTGVPIHTLQDLANYGDLHLPPGSFLQAVLENNFIEACGRADAQNKQRLPEIASYIYMHLPSNCWGSPEKVKEWLSPRESSEL